MDTVALLWARGSRCDWGNHPYHRARLRCLARVVGDTVCRFIPTRRAAKDLGRHDEGRIDACRVKGMRLECLTGRRGQIGCGPQSFVEAVLNVTVAKNGEPQSAVVQTGLHPLTDSLVAHQQVDADGQFRDTASSGGCGSGPPEQSGLNAKNLQRSKVLPGRHENADVPARPSLISQPTTCVVNDLGDRNSQDVKTMRRISVSYGTGRVGPHHRSPGAATGTPRLHSISGHWDTAFSKFLARMAVCGLFRRTLMCRRRCP